MTRTTCWAAAPCCIALLVLLSLLFGCASPLFAQSDYRIPRWRQPWCCIYQDEDPAEAAKADLEHFINTVKDRPPPSIPTLIIIIQKGDKQ